MKVAYKKDREVYLKEIACRALKPDEIRVKVAACGVCGTDIQESPAKQGVESAFGHEIAGTIIEVGGAVSYLKVGLKVVLDSATPCGRCDNCRNAKQELCTDIKSFFNINSFGFAEEMIAPAISAIPCEDLDPAIATLQEPLGVAIDIVRLADIDLDSNVLIMGQGPIGLMALTLVRRAGARRVFVSDFRAKTGRFAMADKCGWSM